MCLLIFPHPENRRDFRDLKKKKKKKSGTRKLLGKKQELKTSQLVAISGMGLPIRICKDKRLLEK